MKKKVTLTITKRGGIEVEVVRYKGGRTEYAVFFNGVSPIPPQEISKAQLKELLENIGKATIRVISNRYKENGSRIVSKLIKF